MSDDGQVALTIDGRVAVIEVRRPPNNFFDLATLTAIADIGESVARDDTARAILLCSAGRNFCAGADFSEGPAGGSRVELSRRVYAQAARIFAFELPVVAAVQGAAVGGGVGLACAADFRVAGETTRFHANFAALGFHHGFALSWSLPRIVGRQQARRLLLEARRIDGATALGLGLADHVVADADIRAAAMEMARGLAANAPLAVRSMKQTLMGDVRTAVPAALDREIAEQARLWDTEDSRIGIAASLARARPEFVAR